MANAPDSSLGDLTDFASLITDVQGIAAKGDLLSQPTQYGGMGLGTIITSALFLTAIVMIVTYMSLSHDGEEPAAIT